MFGPEIIFSSKLFESIQCNCLILTTLINQAKMVTLKQKSSKKFPQDGVVHIQMNVKLKFKKFK